MQDMLSHNSNNQNSKPERMRPVYYHTKLPPSCCGDHQRHETQQVPSQQREAKNIFEAQNINARGGVHTRRLLPSQQREAQEMFEAQNIKAGGGRVQIRR